MAALRADEDLFCRAAWRQIAGRPLAPDVVHAHALPPAARLRQRAIPVVVNLPGPPHARDVADLQIADAIVSDGWGARHLGGIIGRRVDAIRKGVDSTLFAPAGRSWRSNLGLQDKRVVLTVCRLVPLKNVRLLVAALDVLRRTVPDAHLIVVGEGPERPGLEQAVKEFGLQDVVTFIGYVPQAETPAWYRSADVFALSSDFDNSPNAVLEAMACGLPIVATEVGGLRDFVTPGENGALVAPRDAPAFAAALAAYLTAPDRARAMGAANREAAVRRHPWRASAGELHDVYVRVIAARASARRAG